MKHPAAVFLLLVLSPLEWGCPRSTAVLTPAPRSLLGRPLTPAPDGPQRAKLEAQLTEARRQQAANPDDPETLIWVGRRLGYLWRMQEAIAVFDEGVRRWPDHAAFYRHRGHRMISLRRFDDAIRDLEHAARLIEGKPDVIEADGMPNSRDIPLTTLGFNIWYHLGVARFCRGDFTGAADAFEQVRRFINDRPDNRVACYDWLYMCYRRLGRDRAAQTLLSEIRPEMEIIENRAYHRRLLMYAGMLAPTDLIPETAPALADAATSAPSGDSTSDLDWATYGFGVGHWHYVNGELDRAREVWRRTVAGTQWPAFGFIAAEAELARMGDF